MGDQSDHTPAEAPGAPGASIPDDGTPIPGQPTNPDELAPKEQQPDPPEGAGEPKRDPEAIEDEPGMDL